MFSRLGWKWTALAYMTGRIVENGKPLPANITRDLRTTRVQLEGSYESVCDIDAELRDLETELFSVLLDVSRGEVHTMLELLSKAARGELEESDLDLSPLQPIIGECTIPRVCSR
jgi:hypothetical protein